MSPYLDVGAPVTARMNVCASVCAQCPHTSSLLSESSLASQLLGVLWDVGMVHMEGTENKSPSATSPVSEGVEPESLLSSLGGDRNPSENALTGVNPSTTGMGMCFGV